MAHRVVAAKKKQRAMHKLEEIFNERDPKNSGKIGVEELHEVFRIYNVPLADAKVDKIVDETGQVTRSEFLKLAYDSKLTEFEGHLDDKKDDKKAWTPASEKPTMPSRSSDKGLLCCFRSSASEEENLYVSGEPDRIEKAFKKFDYNGDGFLDYEEFQHLASNLDESYRDRLFGLILAIDEQSNGLISLDTFRRALEFQPSRQVVCPSYNDDLQQGKVFPNCSL